MRNRIQSLWVPITAWHCATSPSFFGCLPACLSFCQSLSQLILIPFIRQESKQIKFNQMRAEGIFRRLLVGAVEVSSGGGIPNVYLGTLSSPPRENMWKGMRVSYLKYVVDLQTTVIQWPQISVSTWKWVGVKMREKQPVFTLPLPPTH